MRLCLPLFKPPTAIARRQLRTALGFDELDVVGADAITFDKALLFAVPVELRIMALPPGSSFVPCEIEGDVSGLLCEGSSVLERVAGESEVSKTCTEGELDITYPFSVLASFW
jgi:hypothetical protein